MLRRIVNARLLTNCSKTNAQTISQAITKSNLILNEKKDNFDGDDENEHYENMYVETPFHNVEWGGPLRGGKLLEPTRFGDWERKGRCTDY